MGFLNLPGGLRATGFATPDQLGPGPVTCLSHSGSVFAALAVNDRGVSFDLLVSPGQEIVTTMADYLAFALERESTRVVGLFLETIRDPEGFLDGLRLAEERDVPVVALKVGRTTRSKEMVAAHSGALAGEHGAYEAVFDAFGVHEVSDLDEMLATLALFSSPRRVSRGGGIASVHDSGGERAMLVDAAAEIGVPFARIAESTRTRIDAVLDPGLVAENPLDAWGTGIGARAIFEECLLALADDPETAVVVLCVDVNGLLDEEYVRLASDVFPVIQQPFCVLSNLASSAAGAQLSLLRENSIPVLEGTNAGLRALRHLLTEKAFRERAPTSPSEPVSDDVRRRWRERLAAGARLSEIEGLALLADYGVPVTSGRSVSAADEAVEAAAALGYPVVLKTAAGVLHKSDARGVALGLGDASAVREAYADISARLGPEVVVAQTAPPGVELALGIVRDPSFGPLVLVAAGGVLVELLADRRLIRPPIDEAGGRRALDALTVRPLLDGARGAPPADVDAVVRAISRLSVLATDLGDLIDELDVNPIIAAPGGCVAVDALVVTRSLK